MKAIFISVRTGSTRLPQKALIDIEGRKTIEYLIDRVKRSQYAENIILCTTILEEDDILCDVAHKNNIKCFRGSAPDKLKRWEGAAKEHNVDFFVNADGDDIFFDHGLADICFKQYDNSSRKLDFIDGRGLYNDVYGIKTSALTEVCSFKKDTETEFIRPYFIETEKFVTQDIQDVPEKYKKKNIRMTLDYQDDLDFFKTIIKHCLENKIDMSFENILSFIEENPHVVDINWHCEQSWIDNQDKMINRIMEKNFDKKSK